jgi:hypothetical protein
VKSNLNKADRRTAAHNRTVYFIAVAFGILAFSLHLSVSRRTGTCIKIRNENIPPKRYAPFLEGISMRIIFIILILFLTLRCNDKNNVFNNLLLTFPSNEIQSETEIQTYVSDKLKNIHKFQLSIDLDKFQSIDSFKDTVNSNYCGDLFYIHLPDVSTNTLLPIGNDCHLSVNYGNRKIINVIENDSNNIFSNCHPIDSINFEDIPIFSVYVKSHHTLSTVNSSLTKLVMDYKKYLSKEYRMDLNKFNFENIKEINKKFPLLIKIYFE